MPRKGKWNLAPCGTRSAYNRHLRYGQPTCDKCREAQHAYIKGWIAKNQDRQREIKKKSNRKQKIRLKAMKGTINATPSP